METRRLGTQGLEVSALGLGCMGMSEFYGTTDEGEAIATIHRALELGIDFLDTADMYGSGANEQLVGKAIADRRDRVVLATKFGKPMDENPHESRGSREYIRWAVEGSLRRLRTDTIDLYQMHEPDERTPIEETLGALDELVQEGKVRFIGSSNYDARQIEDAERTARDRGLTRFVAAQNRYSFVKREAEDELLPTCERLGIGMLPYFPLESGLLTGKYRRGEAAPEGTRLASRPDWLTDEAFDRVDALQRFADERGIGLLDVAIGGLAEMPAIASVIAGATRPEQVRANAAAGEWQPSPDDVAALTALR
jgi:aryl-alcohol dehydrogenase-like predicted oxidoreductase